MTMQIPLIFHLYIIIEYSGAMVYSKTQVVLLVLSFGDERDQMKALKDTSTRSECAVFQWQGQLFSIFPEIPDTQITLSHLIASYHPLIPSRFNHFHLGGAVSCQALNASWPYHKRDNAAPPLQHLRLGPGCAMFWVHRIKTKKPTNLLHTQSLCLRRCHVTFFSHG